MADDQEPDEQDHDDEARRPRPVLPVDGPVVPAYFPKQAGQMSVLRQMGLMEAELAKAKLESEGLICFIENRDVAGVNPLVVPDVKLKVPVDQVELAEWILARPAAEDAGGEYADENWRCPMCHRKNVELMPLSPAWRRARAGCLAWLLLPVALGIVTAIIPEINKLIAPPAWGVPAWMVAAVILSLSVLLVPKRRIHCRACGHEWGGDADGG